jgi:hypothetical protein
LKRGNQKEGVDPKFCVKRTTKRILIVEAVYKHKNKDQYGLNMVFMASINSHI